MEVLADILIVLTAWIAGVVSMLGYIIWRMMGRDGWDDSNITNALRLLSHVTLHPVDFGKMYYLSTKQVETISEMDKGQWGQIPKIGMLKRPFWYVDKDEMSEVVQSRPNANGQ